MHGRYLAWWVGTGLMIRVGVDSIMQCDHGTQLPEDLPTGKLLYWCQKMHLGGAHFPMSLALKNSTLVENPNFLVWRRRERFTS